VRQAFGVRDHEFFKLKIPAIHEARYALVGRAEKMRVMWQGAS
jgi:hypothetical protein